MDETATDYRLHDIHAVLKSAFQRSRHHPKTGKKKWGIKVHTVIHTNEGIPSDIKFTSSASNDLFMLKLLKSLSNSLLVMLASSLLVLPMVVSLSRSDRIAINRVDLDYEKFEQLTQRSVIYVTEMKKNLKYSILSGPIYQPPDGLMEVWILNVEFVK